MLEIQHMKPDVSRAMVPSGASTGCYGNTEKKHLGHPHGDRKASQDAPKATGIVQVKRSQGKSVSGREQSVCGGW